MPSRTQLRAREKQSFRGVRLPEPARFRFPYLGIYHFSRTLQSCGSGRQDCINLTMRRIPRVNQEVLLRATFLGWSAGLFFAWGWVMNGVPLARGHRHVEGQGHDKDQAVEAVGVAELGILDAEAAGFEVREHRLDSPAVGILKGAQVAGFFGHRDDPGFSMAWIVDDADVGSRPPAGEVDVFQVVDPVPFQWSSCQRRRT